MSFVRPEARQAIWRWREVLVALAVLALGGWWAFAATGILNWLGYGVLFMGAALLATGVQRGRFRAGRDGPGVVSVDEGQITYFGPLTGGSVALGEMATLRLARAGLPHHWVLSQSGQPDLHIPLTARGADALFDAFTALPGIQTERMLAEMRRNDGQTVVIWQKRTARLH